MVRVKRQTWQDRWSYLESLIISIGLFLCGLALELSLGNFNFYLLATPVNYAMGVLIVLISILLGGLERKSKFTLWLSGPKMSTCLIGSILILSIFKGFGYKEMTSHWSFIILYTCTLISLGTLIARRICHFRIKDFGFYLNHIGIFILLTAGGLAHADMERYIMYVNEGETQWRVYDSNNKVKELPVAIELTDFRMGYYPNTYEPEYFTSDIKVYTKSGKTKEAKIEVNSPLRIDGWDIYQYGYDNAAGPFSSYSSFELVYDKWINLIFFGIILIMFGSIYMIFTGKKKLKL